MKHRYVFPIAVRITRGEKVSGSFTVIGDEALTDEQIEKHRGHVQESLNKQILDKALVKGEFVVQKPHYRTLKR